MFLSTQPLDDDVIALLLGARRGFSLRRLPSALVLAMSGSLSLGVCLASQSVSAFPASASVSFESPSGPELPCLAITLLKASQTPSDASVSRLHDAALLASFISFAPTASVTLVYVLRVPVCVCVCMMQLLVVVLCVSLLSTSILGC